MSTSAHLAPPPNVTQGESLTITLTPPVRPNRFMVKSNDGTLIRAGELPKIGGRDWIESAAEIDGQPHFIGSDPATGRTVWGRFNFSRDIQSSQIAFEGLVLGADVERPNAKDYLPFDKVGNDDAVAERYRQEIRRANPGINSAFNVQYDSKLDRVDLVASVADGIGPDGRTRNVFSFTKEAAALLKQHFPAFPPKPGFSEDNLAGGPDDDARYPGVYIEDYSLGYMEARLSVPRLARMRRSDVIDMAGDFLVNCNAMYQAMAAEDQAKAPAEPVAPKDEHPKLLTPTTPPAKGDKRRQVDRTDAVMSQYSSHLKEHADRGVSYRYDAGEDTLSIRVPVASPFYPGKDGAAPQERPLGEVLKVAEKHFAHVQVGASHENPLVARRDGHIEVQPADVIYLVYPIDTPDRHNPRTILPAIDRFVGGAEKVAATIERTDLQKFGCVVKAADLQGALSPRSETPAPARPGCPVGAKKDDPNQTMLF